MTIDNLWQQPFFTEFSRPAGYGDAAIVVLYRTEHRILSLTMVSHSHEPVIGQERLDQLRIFVPHLQRAIRLGDSIDRHTLTINAYERLLDALGMPVILLNHRGRVRNANLAASEMLKSHNGFRMEEAKLHVVGNAALTDRLNDAIERVADRANASEMESLPFRDQFEKPAIAYIIGLGPEATRQNQSAGPHFAILICSLNQARAPVDALGSLFGLTVSENRVLAHIAEGLNRQETANSLGVVDSTIKSHLDHIYAKTGMNSQAELLECLTRLAAPIRFI